MRKNQKLTDDDVENIRQLIEWRDNEISRINSIAGNSALAEKFDVKKRTIISIGNYESRRIRADSLSYMPAMSEESKLKISRIKQEKDIGSAGDFTRKTGIAAIDKIRELAPTMTKTEVARFIGWKDGSSIDGWMRARGYDVKFKKHMPIPPKRKGWGDLTIGAASRE